MPADLSWEDVAGAAWSLGHPANRAQGMAEFCRSFLLAHGNFNYDLATNGEEWVLRQLAPFQPSVIFDVGANAGNWSLAALAALPGAHVHAFEIVDDTFAKLRRRIGSRPDVTVNAFGLSDSAGELQIHVFEDDDEIASYVPYPHGSFSRRTFPVRRGDDYVRQHAIERIDFLKLDVEGAEHLVLKGFCDTIDAGKIDIIQFEYGKICIMTHFLLLDFYKLLEAKGYRIGKIYPDRVDFRPYALEDEDFIGPNYLAVRTVRGDVIEALKGPA